MGPRNLVLCLDGTNDFAARYPTHVFRLFKTLERSERQLIYYDGGVGTLLEAKLLAKPLIGLYKAIDLAAGFSIRDNFIKAFEFLCDNYQPEDKIYLFGFSRGAYTARAIAAAVKYFGVPGPEHKNLIPFMWQRFSTCGERSPSNPEADNPFVRMSSIKGAVTEEGSPNRTARVHFLGAWDTVSSFGLVNLKVLPGTTKLDGVDIVRHAVSIDEKRNMFPENLIATEHPNAKEVWFAGVHRDVGGGGNPKKLELSMFSYNWMLGEATGLRIDEKKIKKRNQIESDPAGPDNSSFFMVATYALLGFIPMKMWNKSQFRWKWLNFWHNRSVPNCALVHNSVRERQIHLKYNPRNLRKAKNVKFVTSNPIGEVIQVDG